MPHPPLPLASATGMLVGVIYVAALLGRGSFVDPVADPDAFARAMVDPLVGAAGWAYVLSLALHAAVVAWLGEVASAAAPRHVRWGQALSLAALVLTAVAMGAILLAFPPLGRAHLAGDAGAMGIVTAIGPWLGGSIVVEGLLLTIGSGLLAVGLYRAGAPRWAAVAYALAAPMYATPLPGFFVEVAGSALFLASMVGLWTTREAWTPSSGA